MHPVMHSPTSRPLVTHLECKWRRQSQCGVCEVQDPVTEPADATAASPEHSVIQTTGAPASQVEASSEARPQAAQPAASPAEANHLEAVEAEASQLGSAAAAVWTDGATSRDVLANATPALQPTGLSQQADAAPVLAADQPALGAEESIAPCDVAAAGKRLLQYLCF